MATVRTAEAHWEGSLFEGQGEVKLVSSGIGRFETSWPARAEQPNGKTSPEELIAAAHRLLKAGGRQRTDSTHVLAAARAMSRIECVHETLRHALSALAR